VRGLLQAQRPDPCAARQLPELRWLAAPPRGRQAVGQLLRLTFAANDEPRLYWWRREKHGSEAELDFVHALGSRVIPIEVKAGKTGTLRSLHGFMAERGLALALRVNSAPPIVHALSTSTVFGSANYRLLSLPAYLVEHAPRLLGEIGG
jgi:hypothetical protein